MISVAPPPAVYVPTPAPQVAQAFVQPSQASVDSFISSESHWTPPSASQMRAVVSALSSAEVSPLKLPAGYGSLQKLAGQLPQLDSRFSPKTPQGRSALALALAIGGTEVYGQGHTRSDFFTVRGGTGNRMQGFAQFNLSYHRGRISTPQGYAGFLADILHGKRAMPDSKTQSNHVQALTEAVSTGRIRNGRDLQNFMLQRRFGGTNWQGIDDGWGRNPGLANALVQFLRQAQ